ncbi:hypothetical protein V6N12_062448 [Hibiscus sabdariffa]|uniref:DUF4283 domain-containing protein n=1 Tax=Hibiscus sabdariffa TaxID=183260 RepID=A0ABR2F8V5_9ROSI
MENSLPSPRISRKHRRLDNDPLDDGGPLSGSPEAVHQKPIPSIPSYMDSLMKNSSNLPSEIDECIDDDDDDDIEFEEGEVVRNTIDGLISIDFSDRILSLAEKALIRQLLLSCWDVDWVDPWTADFSSTVPFPAKVVVWIRLPGLSVTLYKKSIITEIGECIGPVVKMDFQTECGRRGRFARMAVRIDLDLHHEEPMEAPVIPEQVKPASPFGPWMVVERRQRRITKQPTANPGKSNGVVFRASRFNHIHDLDQVEPSGKRVESFLQPQPQSVVQTALSKAKLKSKISHSTSRLASKTTPTVNLDTSKHSTVVMDENSNPNVHHFFRPLDDPANGNFKHIAGDSSTRPLGDPPDNSINSVVQPEGPDTLGKIRNNSGTNPKEGLSHALDSITRVSCTSLWHALSSYWSKLRAGVAWSIGNGSIVRPLDDVWVPSLGPLRDYLVSPDSFFSASSLSDLLDSEGNWDCRKLVEYFTIDAFPHILSSRALTLRIPMILSFGVGTLSIFSR